MIRAMTAGDIPSVVAVAESNARGRMLKGVSYCELDIKGRVRLAGKYASKEALQDLLEKEDEMIFVYEDNGELLAFINLSFRAQAITIESVNVKKDAQNRGIGTELIKFTVRSAKDKGRGRVLLYPLNERSEALYKKLGFKSYKTVDMFSYERGMFPGKVDLSVADHPSTADKSFVGYVTYLEPITERCRAYHNEGICFVLERLSPGCTFYASKDFPRDAFWKALNSFMDAMGAAKVGLSIENEEFLYLLNGMDLAKLESDNWMVWEISKGNT